MERESHPNNQPNAAGRGIPLPHSALEAGLSRFAGSSKEDSSGKKEKKKTKAGSKARAAARTVLGGQVADSGLATGGEAPQVQAETLSTWRRLLTAEPAGKVNDTADGAGKENKAQADASKPSDETAAADQQQEAAADSRTSDAAMEAMEFPIDAAKAQGAAEERNKPAQESRGEEMAVPESANEPPLTPPPLVPWMHEQILPADPADDGHYEQSIARDLPPLPEGEPGDNGYEPPEPPLPPGSGNGIPSDGPQRYERTQELASGLAVGQPRYETTTPPGLERTPADVSRAAWMGVAFGWFIGRRGKGKAVKRAVAAVEARYKKLMAKSASRPAAGGVAERAYARSGTDIETIEMPPSETTPSPETRSLAAAAAEKPAVPSHIRIDLVRERTAPSPAWVMTGVAPKVTARTMERLAAAPLPEALALPAAAAAARSRAEHAPQPVLGAKSEAALGKDEMMQMAKTIKIEGVPLSEIYGSKQIDEEGLRAVIETYLRGGDVQQRLSYEIIEKQKSFERDPLSRKRSHGQFRQAIQAFGQASNRAAEKGVEAARSAQKVAGKAGQSLRDGAQKASTTISNSSDNQLWLGVTAIAIIWTLILFLILG